MYRGRSDLDRLQLASGPVRSARGGTKSNEKGQISGARPVERALHWPVMSWKACSPSSGPFPSLRLRLRRVLADDDEAFRPLCCCQPLHGHASVQESLHGKRSQAYCLSGQCRHTVSRDERHSSTAQNRLHTSGPGHRSVEATSNWPTHPVRLTSSRPCAHPLTLLAGGAERLVIDAACGLQELGHHVHIYTSHWEKERCFEETRNGARVPLSVLRGDFGERGYRDRLTPARVWVPPFQAPSA